MAPFIYVEENNKEGSQWQIAWELQNKHYLVSKEKHKLAHSQACLFAHTGFIRPELSGFTQTHTGWMSKYASP